LYLKLESLFNLGPGEQANVAAIAAWKKQMGP